MPSTLFSWPGSKRRLLDQIIPRFPSGLDQVVSPFVGCGAVEMRLAYSGVRVFASDIHPGLCRLWEMLLTRPDVIANRIGLLRGRDRAAMQEAVRFGEKSDHEKTIGLYLRLRACLYHKPRSTTLTDGWRNELTIAKEMLIRDFSCPNLSVSEKDYRLALDDFPAMFVYCDPPYIEEKTDQYESLYSSKGFSHEELFGRLAQRDRWILSINDCERVRDTFREDVEIIPVGVRWSLGTHRTKHGDTRKRPVRQELIIVRN